MRQLDPADGLAGVGLFLERLGAAVFQRVFAVVQLAQQLRRHQFHGGSLTELPHVARAQFGFQQILVLGDGFHTGRGRDRCDSGIGACLLAAHGRVERQLSAGQRLPPSGTGFALVLDLARIEQAVLDHAAVGRDRADRAVAAVIVEFRLQLQCQVECVLVPAATVLELPLRCDPAIGRYDHAKFHRGLAAGLVAADDVGQHRIAGHVDARRGAADQFDAIDRSGTDALEQVRNVLALAGRARAVDQDIALCRRVTAHIGVGLDDGEPGQALHHLVGIGRRAAGEIIVIVDAGVLFDASGSGYLRVGRGDRPSARHHAEPQER